MCLILFAYDSHPDYRLIVAANRDEYYERPTEGARWRDSVLSGIDLLAGGTWLGLTRGGRFAALTNYRSPAEHVHGKASRGELVHKYLHTGEEAETYAKELETHRETYNGYNLLFGSVDDIWWFSNKANGYVRLTPGVYGLSNHLLDTPWPKVERGKKLLKNAIAEGPAPEKLISILEDTHYPPENTLPSTGVKPEVEKMLSPMFIKSDGYGTRSSTVIMAGRDGRVSFTEKTHDGNGHDGIFTDTFFI